MFFKGSYFWDFVEKQMGYSKENLELVQKRYSSNFATEGVSIDIISSEYVFCLCSDVF